MDKKPEARPGSLENALDASVTWRYFAPAGTTLEMVERPDYWGNVVRELGQQRVNGRHAWHKIEVLAEDGTWEALLRVVSIAPGHVRTRRLSEWHAPVKQGRKPNLPEGYLVEFIQSNGWRALDVRGEIIASNLGVEDEAIRAAHAHSKLVAGKDAA